MKENKTQYKLTMKDISPALRIAVITAHTYLILLIIQLLVLVFLLLTEV